MPEPRPHVLRPDLQVGDRVAKTGGDYEYEGVVVGVITKLSGAVRYVVEDPRGLLFIFSRRNLMAAAGEAAGAGQ